MTSAQHATYAAQPVMKLLVILQAALQATEPPALLSTEPLAAGAAGAGPVVLAVVVMSVMPPGRKSAAEPESDTSITTCRAVTALLRMTAARSVNGSTA
mmetsp:Transcript_12385/g.37270  ORF Transcript_12385/g.37270 Transcript_12385/m.37270 type:complete len:99 (+) Transcript_12385:989-1285(+)